MSERIHREACQTVINRDLSNMVDIQKYVTDCEKKAESCGCHNCKMELKKARTMLDDYRNMVAHLHLVDIGKIPFVFANPRLLKGRNGEN